MPHVDVQFGIQGDLIPADHGYLLFAAVSGAIPTLLMTASESTPYRVPRRETASKPLPSQVT